MSLTSKQIIALKNIPNCGVKTVRGITEYAKDLFPETPRELADLINECIKNKIASRLKDTISVDFIEEKLTEAEYILDKSLEYGIRVVNYQEDSFPKKLLNTIDEKGNLDVPILLYYKGDLNVSSLPGIAIIGTREPTPEGIKAGTYFGKLFADKGYNIVSGLAIGCDTAGHKGALLSTHGKTTSFLAHGLDSIYPPENTELAEDIVARGGLLLSEYPIGTRVNRYNLVARDRLQAALADATIVIQTATKGGTMHASNTTLVANKPLFCVKYLNLDYNSKVSGNELLVSKGAQYITSQNAEELVEHALKGKML